MIVQFNHSVIIFSPSYHFKPVLLSYMEQKDILRNVQCFFFYMHTIQ